MVKYVIFIFLILLTFSAQAQIEDAEIIIEKDRNITLPEANRDFEKISYTPLITEEDKTPQRYLFQKFDYPLLELSLTTKPVGSKIKSEKEIETLHGGYAKAGFGNYTTPYLEGFLGSTKNKNFQYNLHVKHLSSQTGPILGKNSANSENLIQAGGKYFLNKDLMVAGKIYYQRNGYYFYGYNPIAEVDRDSTKQLINTIGFQANLLNSNANTPLQYSVGLGINYLSDHYQAQEFTAAIPAQVRYKLQDNMTIQTDAQIFITQRKDATTISRNLVALKPTLQYTANDLTVAVGGNLVYENDTVSTTKNLHLYPHLVAEYKINPIAVVFAGVTGNIQRTSLTQFLQENPFVAPNANLVHTNEKLNVSGGVKGYISSLSYKIEANYKTYQNLFFFVNSATDSSKFDVIYENGTSNLLTFKGEIGFAQGEKWQTSLGLQYFHYGNLTTVEKPWHRPTFVANASATYKINPKLQIGAELFSLAGIVAKNFQTNEEINLNPIIDLNLKADYLIFNNFSAFLSLNNLIGNKYQRYLYYSQKGIQVLAGITYRFL